MTHEEYVAKLAKIKPTIEVLGTYVKGNIEISHKCKNCNHEWEIAPHELLKGRQCPKCSLTRKKTHEEYIAEVAKLHPNIKVLGKYINNKIKILHKCQIDNYEWESTPNQILRRRGCPVCSGYIIGPPPEYKNSIWASEHKDFFSRYLTEKQMKLYTPHSAQKIQITCPDCKRNKQISIDRLYTQGLCCKCGDGQSYPNKFIYSMLEQLKIPYINEYCPNWSNKKRYDIYLPSFNCIIEMHGPQHYIDIGFRTTLEYEQNNDKNKKEMALKNHIKNYIIINCSRSDKQYIKNNIMNSTLPSLLNFSENDINWNECHIFALSNLVKVVADKWNQTKSINVILSKLKISKSTIKNYLKIASELNWCDWYSGLGKEIYYKKMCGDNNPQSKKVIKLSNGMIYNTVTQAMKDNHISQSALYKRLKTHQDFMYYDEWLEQQKEDNKTS